MAFHCMQYILYVVHDVLLHGVRGVAAPDLLMDAPDSYLYAVAPSVPPLPDCC